MISIRRLFAIHGKRWSPLTRFLWPGVVLAILLLGGRYSGGRAAETIPTAVDLIYFRGEGGDGVAFLEWETGTERDTAGFQLERADSVDGPYTGLDEIGFVDALGSVSAGAYYEKTDDTVVNGRTYWYKLLEYTHTGTIGDEWTVRVSVDPEPTSQVIGGGGGTETATNTPVPTSTIRPTATDRPPSDTPTSVASPNGNSSEAEASSTPRPTATIQPTRTPRPTAPPDGNSNPSETTRTISGTATATDESSGVEAVGAPATADSGDPASGSAEDAGPDPSGEETVGQEVAANSVEAAANEQEPGAPGARSVGSAADDGEAGTAADESVVRQEGESSSLLLWLGFIAAFLIFVGGVAFSIFLSTRKRDEEL